MKNSTLAGIVGGCECEGVTGCASVCVKMATWGDGDVGGGGARAGEVAGRRAKTTLAGTETTGSTRPHQHAAESSPNESRAVRHEWPSPRSAESSNSAVCVRSLMAAARRSCLLRLSVLEMEVDQWQSI